MQSALRTWGVTALPNESLKPLTAEADVMVSVIIPCHNSATYLEETARSVLAQSLDGIEMVFVDDGSSDNTVSTIEALIASVPHARCRLLIQPQSGVAAARNTGIRASSGRYVLPLDADDLIEPLMLEDCVRILEQRPDASIAYTNRRDFGDFDRVWTAGSFEIGRLKYFNQLTYCAVFRRTLWESVAGYQSNVDGFDDWDFWIACAAQKATALHVPHPYVLHRRRRDSRLWTLIDQYEQLFAQIILNHPDVYSAREIDDARRFLSEGKVSSTLRLSRVIFREHYYNPYSACKAEAGVES